MASNKVSFFLVLCLCILSAGECIESPIFTGNKCSDPTGLDKDGKCLDYCHAQGYPGGSCQGFTDHYMCVCKVG
ncbi:hypothetical protein ISN44_As07g018250 [Arabidopsis suecica]|uniref:Uncharacterized protein n=1 Tax=Arabidopsis suecica TaxID=45249 RepID=A0A8T2C1W0_ARASU|nr:hypothetical protein ISN44_As07g018250 [Arabidopsis suecica]